MAIIKLPILYKGNKESRKLSTLFDADCLLSCIHPSSLEGLFNPIPLGRKRIIPWLNNIVVEEIASVNFYINDVLLSDGFLVVPGLHERIIIGGPTIHKWRIRLDHQHQSLSVNPDVAKIRIPFITQARSERITR